MKKVPIIGESGNKKFYKKLQELAEIIPAGCGIIIAENGKEPSFVMNGISTIHMLGSIMKVAVSMSGKNGGANDNHSVN